MIVPGCYCSYSRLVDALERTEHPSDSDSMVSPNVDNRKDPSAVSRNSGEYGNIVKDSAEAVHPGAIRPDDGIAIDRANDSNLL